MPNPSPNPSLNPDPDPGYWRSRWPGEDAGPRRTQAPANGPGLGIGPGERLEVLTRDVPAATMVVLRDPGEAYLLRHTGGDGAISWVERIDPETLEPIERSPDLGRRPDLARWARGPRQRVAVRRVRPPRPPARRGHGADRVAGAPACRPYNSFVVLPDGNLATKDFGGTLPGGTAPSPEPAELLVLEPERLEIVARLTLPERSIARLSADGDDIYVVGDESLLRVRWDGSDLALDDRFRTRYRTIDGQGYGWDTVLDGGAAWFLDDGEGSERYAGSFRGLGVSTAPLHLVRVDLGTGAVTTAEVCGEPGRHHRQPPGRRPAARRSRWATTVATGCSPRSRSATTGRSPHAGPGPSTTPRTWCATATPASSSPPTTTTSGSPTRSWCSISGPEGRSPAPTPAAAPVGGVPGRRVRAGSLPVLVHDPGPRPRDLSLTPAGSGHDEVPTVRTWAGTRSVGTSPPTLGRGHRAEVDR